MIKWQPYKFILGLVTLHFIILPIHLHGYTGEFDEKHLNSNKETVIPKIDSDLFNVDSCLQKFQGNHDHEYYDCILSKAHWFKKHNRFSETILLVEHCQPYFLNTGNREKVAECNFIIGFCHSELGNYPNSIKNLLAAIHIFDSLSLKNELYNSYNTLAVNFYLLNKLKLAQTIWEDVYQYANGVNDSLLLSKCLNNLAIVSGMNEQAIELYTKSIGLSLIIGDSAGASNSMMNLASLYLNQKVFDKAKSMLFKADQLNKSNFNPTQQIYIYLNQAQLYYELHKFDSALYFATQCQILSERIQFYTLMTDVFTIRANIFEQKNKLSEAINNMRLSMQWKDSLWQEHLASATAELEMKYHTQKQIDEIHIQQAIIKKQESDLKARTYLIAGMLFVLICIIFFGIIYVWYSKKLKKSNDDLLLKNEIINHNNIKLQETIAFRDRLLSIIAHDIKNPLSTISGFAELITLSTPFQESEKVKSFGEQILNSSNNLFDLLDNLLNWAKSQQLGIVLKPEPISIYRLVQKNIKLLGPMAFSKNITLTNQCSPEYTIIADKASINTVIRNLVNNAIKFTPSNGLLTVYEEKSENSLRIHFADTGVGIHADDLPLLFKNDIDRNLIGKNLPNKGIGLGLILCHDFMVLNGGSISVTSEWEKGTIFTLTFPNKKES